jgi:hypothetical protein
VDYDNRLQCRYRLSTKKRRHHVTRVLGKCKGTLSSDDLAFIVQTDNAEIYILDLHICNQLSQGQFYKSFWVLNLKVVQNAMTASSVAGMA